MLTKINEAFARHGINISGQYLQTNAEIGYVVIDIDSDDQEQALNELKAIPGTLKARVSGIVSRSCSTIKKPPMAVFLCVTDYG